MFVMNLSPQLALSLFVIILSSCGHIIVLGGGGSTGPGAAQDRTGVLEGVWTLTVTDSLGEYQNLITFSDSDEILAWHDQYDNEFFSDLTVGVSDITVSATNEVSLYLYYEFEFENNVYATDLNLGGVLFGNDNILQLSGNSQVSMNGELLEVEVMSILATRGDTTDGGSVNDSANTQLLEGRWFVELSDLFGTQIHSIEFSQDGSIRHWLDQYGNDLALIDDNSNMFALVSSSMSTDLGAQYTFSYEDNVYDVFVDMSGVMDQTNDQITLDGVVKTYSNGILFSLLHTTANAFRYIEAVGNDGANSSQLEGDWVFAIESESLIGYSFYQHNVVCGPDGAPNNWLVSDDVDALVIDPNAVANMMVSSDNNVMAILDYEDFDYYDDPYQTTINVQGVVNEFDNAFMQLIGSTTYDGYFGVSEIPIFISAYRPSLTTSVAGTENGSLWPMHTSSDDVLGAPHGPLFAPWAFE